MSTFIENQNWRYATKKFDATKKISDENIALLKKAIQSAARSYALQPYKVFFIENPEVRAQLQPTAWGQSQIVDASHLIVFASINKLDEAYIEAFVQNMATTRNLQVADLEGYATFMKGAILNMPEDKMATWTAKQTYIALGNMMTAAAIKGIDSCPIEGFEKEKVEEILNLDISKYQLSCIVPFGYRINEQSTQLREPLNNVVEFIK